MANRVNSFNVQGNTYGVEADLTFDDSPTIGSANPVTSNGIAEAIQSVTLGDSISYGRTDGTPVGYCSISYGTNNSAVSSYGISIGNNNVNTCYCGLAIGDNNRNLGNNACILLGDQNTCSAYSSVAIGLDGAIGSRITTNIGDEPSYNARVFIGYVNISGKKIYYDPDMEQQITVDIATGEDCFFVDKTEGVANRNPGDVYLYKRTARYTYTLRKIENQYVRLTNRAFSALYIYRGLSYYDAANDKNYYHYDPSTHTFSDDVTNTSWYERPALGHIYYDVLSGNFLLYVSSESTYIIGQPGTLNWIKVKVYKGATYYDTYSNNSVSKSNILNQLKGIYGYIYASNEDTSKKYKVYSRSDYGDDCEITNTLVDGLMVVNLADRGRYGSNAPLYMYYICDVNGTPRLAKIPHYSESENNAYWNVGRAAFGQCSLVMGESSHTVGGGYGHIVCGEGCEVYGATEGLAVFGSYNSCDVGPYLSGQCSSILAGRYVNITSHSQYFHTFFAFGHTVSATYDAYSNSDNTYIMGRKLTIYNNANGHDNFVFGCNMDHKDIGHIYASGHGGRIEDISYVYTYGYGHYINGAPATILTMNDSGIWTGSGVTYDANTGTYSFPQNTLFKLRGIPAEWTSDNRYTDRTSSGFIGYAKSTDGTTLTMIPGKDPTTLGYITSVGVMNYYQMDSNVSPLTLTNTGYNTLVGYSNTVKWRSNYYGITTVGSNLTVEGDILKNSMYVGAYNTMTGTTGAMFVVGIGDSSTSKNGLAIFSSGVIAAPSSPDTINAGTAAMASTGLNSDKMVVTYGMMKDYTGPGGGGSSRPHVDTITLVATDWDGTNLDQTVSLTGMTAGAIVIIQPVGSPYEFNYHSIYLDSQGADELTFKCGSSPSNDISVKVVYWP